jgi:hypothetical protein
MAAGRSPASLPWTNASAVCRNAVRPSATASSKARLKRACAMPLPSSARTTRVASTSSATTPAPTSCYPSTARVSPSGARVTLQLSPARAAPRGKRASAWERRPVKADKPAYPTALGTAPVTAGLAYRAQKAQSLRPRRFRPRPPRLTAPARRQRALLHLRRSLLRTKSHAVQAHRGFGAQSCDHLTADDQLAAFSG